MIKINGKEYRNIQEQVAKNQEDIEELKQSPAVDAYTKEEADTKFETKEEAFSGDYDDLTNKPTILEYESGDGILITSSGDDLRQISVSSDVAMKTDLVAYHAGTNITFTAHTGGGFDINASAGASIYEYELQFESDDLSQEYHMRFISSDGTLVNTSVPESFAELVDFVKSYGISKTIGGSVTNYEMNGYLVDENSIQFCNLRVTSNNGTDTMFYSAGSVVAAITSSDIYTSTITLYKRTV